MLNQAFYQERKDDIEAKKDKWRRIINDVSFEELNVYSPKNYSKTFQPNGTHELKCSTNTVKNSLIRVNSIEALNHSNDIESFKRQLLESSNNDELNNLAKDTNRQIVIQETPVIMNTSPAY